MQRDVPGRVVCHMCGYASELHDIESSADDERDRGTSQPLSLQTGGLVQGHSPC